MGRKYGLITKKGTGLVTYALSPHELKAYPYLWKKVVPNTAKRFFGKWPVIFVPFAILSWSNWSTSKSEYFHSKAYLEEHPE